MIVTKVTVSFVFDIVTVLGHDSAGIKVKMEVFAGMNGSFIWYRMTQNKPVNRLMHVCFLWAGSLCQSLS